MKPGLRTTAGRRSGAGPGECFGATAVLIEPSVARRKRADCGLRIANCGLLTAGEDGAAATSILRVAAGVLGAGCKAGLAAAIPSTGLAGLTGFAGAGWEAGFAPASPAPPMPPPKPPPPAPPRRHRGPRRRLPPAPAARRRRRSRRLLLLAPSPRSAPASAASAASGCAIRHSAARSAGCPIGGEITCDGRRRWCL